MPRLDRRLNIFIKSGQTAANVVPKAPRMNPEHLGP